MTQAGLIAGATSLADSLNALASRRFAGEQASMERESMMDRLMAEMKNREAMMRLQDMLGQEAEKRERGYEEEERGRRMEGFESVYGGGQEAPGLRGAISEQFRGASTRIQEDIAAGMDFDPGDIREPEPYSPAGPLHEDLPSDIQQFIGGAFGELPPGVQPYAAEYMQPEIEESRAAARDAEILSDISPLLNPAVAGIATLRGLAMAHSIGIPVVAPEMYETLDDSLMRMVQRDRNLFEYAGFRGFVMGQSAEDTVTRLEAMGIEGTDVAWVEKTVDMYRQMNTPRAPAGRGIGAGEDLGDLPEFTPESYMGLDDYGKQRFNEIAMDIGTTFPYKSDDEINREAWAQYQRESAMEFGEPSEYELGAVLQEAEDLFLERSDLTHLGVAQTIRDKYDLSDEDYEIVRVHVMGVER